MKMNQIRLYLACLLSLFLFLSSSGLQAQNARIKIDTERKIDQIDPLIYGNFVEHLGHCIYEGIYDPASPLADAGGFRTDVARAAREPSTRPATGWSIAISIRVPFTPTSGA